MWWLFLTVLREQTNTIEHVNERVIRGAWSNFIIFGRRQARPFPIAFDLYTKLTKPAASCSFILQLVSIFSSKRRQMRIYSWERLNFKKKKYIHLNAHTECHFCCDGSLNQNNEIKICHQLTLWRSVGSWEFFYTLPMKNYLMWLRQKCFTDKETSVYSSYVKSLS